MLERDEPGNAINASLLLFHSLFGCLLQRSAVLLDPIDAGGIYGERIGFVREKCTLCAEASVVTVPLFILNLIITPSKESAQ